MLQVITANIGGHRNLRADRLNPTQTAYEIRQNLDIDPTLPTLIAFQEAVQIRFDDLPTHDISDLIAHQLGAEYHSYFAPKTSTTHHPNVCVWDVPAYQGASFVTEGNSIVTNQPLGQWAWGASIPICVTIGQPRLYSTGGRDTEPRNVIAVPVQTEAYGTVYFIGTHLSTLRGEDRHDRTHPITQHAEQLRVMETAHILGLLDELRQSEQEAGIAPRPCILVGDFNANVPRPEIEQLLTEFVHYQPEQPHYTHINHQIDIDHIFVSDPQGLMPAPHRVDVQTERAFPDGTDHLLKIAIF